MAEMGPQGGSPVAPATELHVYVATELAVVEGERARGRTGRVVEKCIFIWKMELLDFLGFDVELERCE